MPITHLCFALGQHGVKFLTKFANIQTPRHLAVRSKSVTPRPVFMNLDVLYQSVSCSLALSFRRCYVGKHRESFPLVNNAIIDICHVQHTMRVRLRSPIGECIPQFHNPSPNLTLTLLLNLVFPPITDRQCLHIRSTLANPDFRLLFSRQIRIFGFLCAGFVQAPIYCFAIVSYTGDVGLLQCSNVKTIT